MGTINDPISSVQKLMSIDIRKEQNYSSRYTEENQKTHRYIIEKLLAVWPGRVHPEIIKAAYNLGIAEKNIAFLDILSEKMERMSGMRFYVCDDVLSDPELFAGYKRWAFPSTLYIRDWIDRDYTPKPDLVHEQRGHGSALAIPPYAKVCQKIGAIVEAFNFHPLVMEIMDKIHWYLVEFPLVLGKSDILYIVGPGIISSPKECKHALQGFRVKRHEVDPEKAFEVFDHVCSMEKEIYHLQYDLWVFRSFEDFEQVLNTELPKYLRAKTGILPLPY